MTCSHCRGTQYVFVRWIEQKLEQQGIHMADLLTDLPREVFKAIPLDYLFYCHCNIRIVIFKNSQRIHCKDCDGTSWRFTETAAQEGYHKIKITRLSTDEIKALPCAYFERCPCDADDKYYESKENAVVFKEFLALLCKSAANIRLAV